MSFSQANLNQIEDINPEPEGVPAKFPREGGLPEDIYQKLSLLEEKISKQSEEKHHVFNRELPGETKELIYLVLNLLGHRKKEYGRPYINISLSSALPKSNLLYHLVKAIRDYKTDLNAAALFAMAEEVHTRIKAMSSKGKIMGIFVKQHTTYDLSKTLFEICKEEVRRKNVETSDIQNARRAVQAEATKWKMPGMKYKHEIE